MNRTARKWLSLALVLGICLPLVADDQKGKAPERKKPDPAAAILRKLQRADLTADQVTKIKTLAEKAAALRPRLTLSEEQRAKLAEAKKNADGKDAKTLFEAILTPEQKASLQKARDAQAGLMKKIFALLTDEQKAKLRGPANKPRDQAVKQAEARKVAAEKRAAEAKKRAAARRQEAKERAAEAKKRAEAAKPAPKKPAPKKPAPKKPAPKKPAAKPAPAKPIQKQN